MILSCLQRTNFDILPVRCYISYTENLPLQSTLQFKAIVANSFHAIVVIYMCALAMITSSGWIHTLQPSHVYLVSTLITHVMFVRHYFHHLQNKYA